MTKLQEHINRNFSNELKLIVFLSQNNSITDSNINLKNIRWELFIKLIRKHRLVSHVINHKNTKEYLPNETFETLKAINLEQIKRSLLFNSELLKIHGTLIEQNIKHIFFKGSLLSFELYNDIGFRNFRDIDLLVDKENIDKATTIIKNCSYSLFEPEQELNKLQKKINYKISHHYHLRHNSLPIDIELHWNLTNPKSFLSIPTKRILNNRIKLQIQDYNLPYISKSENIIFLAAHGAIHQWYRLFWLKDFSVLISKTNNKDLYKIYELSKKLKLDRCFLQACILSQQLYNISLPTFLTSGSIKLKLLYIPIKSIAITELKQRGILGKLNYVLYRLNLKPDYKYYFHLVYRLRTHFSDWEILKLPNSLFFLYYPLRPLLMIYKSLKRN